jgi:general stress protein 26
MALSDKQRIVKIMKQTLGHTYFATCDDDQPIIRSMTPIIEDDMTIWIITFSNSRKIKQIKKNPKICLLFIEQPNGNKTARVMGKVKIIDDLKTKKYVWKIAHYDPSSYFPKGPEHPPFCVLKIIPSKIEWWDSWKQGRKIYKPTKK